MRINLHRFDLPPKPDEITLSRKERPLKSLIIVNARDEREFAKKHIRGGLNHSEEKFDCLLGDFLDIWSYESTILIYCNV